MKTIGKHPSGREVIIEYHPPNVFMYSAYHGYGFRKSLSGAKSAAREDSFDLTDHEKGTAKGKWKWEEIVE